jgi:hypothetical protein
MLNCLVLCGQTILALLALGLAGGWILCVFRRPDRPYLWLAAPLSGIAIVGGTVMGLYFFGGMRLAPALLLSWSVSSGYTLFRLRRERIALPDRRSLLLPLVGAALLCAWGTIACNIHSIREGEPNIAVVRGTDMFGYALAAQWVSEHPVSEVPRRSEAVEGFQHLLLHLEGSRHTSYFMTAAAGLFRGLPPLFAYDWWSGVVLCAAALGLAGLFAAEPLGLLLLMAVAVTSSWLPTARSGYLGKITGYPACLLLAFLFLETWRRPSLSRILCCLAIVPGISFSINPVMPVLVLGVVVGGVIVALIFDGVFRPTPDAANAADDFPNGLRAALRAIGLYLLIPIPPFLFYFFYYVFPGMPPYELPWGIAIPAALDLDQASTLVHVMPRLISSGIFVSLILALLFTAGLRCRSEARIFLMAIGLIPLALILRKPAVYGFLGLLYPLTMAGAALLLGHQIRGGRATRRAAMATFVIACTGAILHFPQMRQSLQIYVTVDRRSVLLVTQREIDALSERIGDDAVDVALLNQIDALGVAAQLSCRGARVNFRSPTWEMTFADWSENKRSNGSPPKAKYSLVPAGMHVPRECVRYRGRSVQLLEDAKSVSIVSVKKCLYMIADDECRPLICLGAEPVEVVLHNGADAPVAATLVGNVAAGPPSAIAEPTLAYRCGEQCGSMPLSAQGARLRLPLTLAPGMQTVVLTVATSSDSTNPSLPAGTPLLSLGDFHVDAEPPASILPYSILP